MFRTLMTLCWVSGLEEVMSCASVPEALHDESLTEAELCQAHRRRTES